MTLRRLRCPGYLSWRAGAGRGAGWAGLDGRGGQSGAVVFSTSSAAI